MYIFVILGHNAKLSPVEAIKFFTFANLIDGKCYLVYLV